MSSVKSCTCGECVSACKNAPGWMTPQEAVNAIKAGYAKKLMRDWLEPCSQVGNEQRIYVICPAVDGREGDDAPEFSFAMMLSGKGRCTFLTKHERCKIHNSGFKPKQCRLTLCCSEAGREAPDNYEMARLWDTPKGRAVVEQWQEGAK